MKRALVVAIFFLGGCAAKKPGAVSPGPNYSTTPCSDNCGADATCNAGCTPVSNQNMPPGKFSH